MEQRRPDGFEWSLDQKLQMIRDAGFDGAGVRFFDREYARQVTQRLREWGLTWQAQCYPQHVEDLVPILEHVAEFGADHLNLQADVRPHTVAECVPLIEGWRRLAADAGVPLHFETHRDRMTTDLYFTLRLLDRFPDLRLTGDLSHYVVGREFAWPISDENHRLMHRVIDNCWGFHGRVASREQIQVQISFAHQRDWLDLFMGWWEYGFRSWRRRAPADAVLTLPVRARAEGVCDDRPRRLRAVRPLGRSAAADAPGARAVAGGCSSAKRPDPPESSPIYLPRTRSSALQSLLVGASMRR